MAFPLLILSILTCVLISMFFYETTIKQCQLHEALRCEAGEVTELTRTMRPPDYNRDDLTVSRGDVLRDGAFCTVSGTSHTEMIRRLLLYQRGSEDTESLWHACDGVSYIRYFMLIKHGAKDIKK